MHLSLQLYHRSVGCATLTRDPNTGNPTCGGCFEGDSFSGTYDGTRPAGYWNYDLNKTTTITGSSILPLLRAFSVLISRILACSSNNKPLSVEASLRCDAADCSTSADFEVLYQEILTGFTSFFNSGQLETEIHTWANKRLPPVAELFSIQVNETSFYTDGTFENPLEDPEDEVSTTVVTATGELSVPGLNTEVTAVLVTTSGSFSTSGLDASSLDSSQVEEVTRYFESGEFTRLVVMCAFSYQNLKTELTSSVTMCFSH